MKDYLRSIKRYVGGKIGIAALAYTPSVLWFMDWNDMDANLDGTALVGMALAGFVLIMVKCQYDHYGSALDPVSL